jgi:hypothetical protein
MNIKKLSIACILPSALLLFTAVPARSVTLLSDNFNTENGGVGSINYSASNSAIFTNWIGGQMGLYGNGVNDIFPGNGLYVAFPTVSPGGVLASKQRLTLTAGDTLTLSFKAASVGSGTLGVAQISDVFSNSIFNYLIPFSATNVFQQFSTTLNITPTLAQLAAATPQFLYFQSVNAANLNGRLLLDDILLTSNPTVSTPVPEPSNIPGLLLFCASFFGLKKLFRQVSRETR